MIQTRYEDIKLTTESNKDYTIEVEVDYSIDRNYGADADGNRGKTEAFIDDIKIRTVLNKDGDDLFPRLKKRTIDKLYEYCRSSL
jgi:hypothetical protein